MRTAARERYRGTIAALSLQYCSASSVPPIVLHNQRIFLGSYDVLGPFACGRDEVEGFGLSVFTPAPPDYEMSDDPTRSGTINVLVSVWLSVRLPPLPFSMLK